MRLQHWPWSDTAKSKHNPGDGLTLACNKSGSIQSKLQSNKIVLDNIKENTDMQMQFCLKTGSLSTSDITMIGPENRINTLTDQHISEPQGM